MTAGQIIPAVTGVSWDDYIQQHTSPRAWAFGLIGIHEYLRRLSGDRRVLLELFEKTAQPDWRWFQEDQTSTSRSKFRRGCSGPATRVASYQLAALFSPAFIDPNRSIDAVLQRPRRAC